MTSLLSFLNVSNPDKLGCDSGVIFHRLIMEYGAARGWNIFIASPVDIGVKGADHIPFEPGANKFEVRYRFDWEYIAGIIRKHSPDVLVINQIELVESFRALLLTEGLETRIVTYCHYWPIMKFRIDGTIEWDPSLNHSGLAEGILLRILRAFQTSDLFMVTSHYARSLLEAAAKHYNIDHGKTPPVIVNCPADPLFLPNNPECNWNSNRILYNSRLYEQYGTSHFLDAISELSDLPFEFVITDFLNNRNTTRAHLDASVAHYRAILQKLPNARLVLNGDIRSVYHSEIVSGSFLNFAPHRINANWSMGAVDCMGMGIPAIAGRMASFPEFVPESLLYDNLVECVQLIRKLRTDQLFYVEMSEQVHQKAKCFDSKRIADLFFASIEKII